MSTFTLPLFPLPEVFLFPGTFLPLHIFEPRYRSMLTYCLENGNEMGIVPYPRNWTGSGPLPLEKIFGWGHVIQCERLEDGRSNILLEGLGTAEIIDYESMEPFRISNVRKIDQDKVSKSNSDFKDMLAELLLLTKRILLAEGAEELIILKINHIANHMFPIDFIASILNFEYRKKQEILETVNLLEKSHKLLSILRDMNLRE